MSAKVNEKLVQDRRGNIYLASLGLQAAMQSAPKSNPEWPPSSEDMYKLHTTLFVHV